MPIVSFASLPAESRVWVFGSDKPLEPNDAARLLSEVDRFLEQWRAHGAPLTAARDWRENRFLTVGVDTTQESASGCSIDGLFRSLAALEGQLGVRLLAGGRVFYRDVGGQVRCVGRDEFSDLAARAEVADDTPVFDTSVTSAGDWRVRFEAPAREAWVRELLRV